MTYPTDGSSHANGLSNEDKLLAWLGEKLKDNPNVFGFQDKYKYGLCLQVEKKGGTKYKDDLVLLSSNNKVLGISAKRWTGATHDWCNISAAVTELSNKYPSFRSIIQSGLEITKEGRTEEERIANQRIIVKEAGSQQIDWLNENPEELRLFLQNQFEKIKNQEVILNDIKNKQWVSYKGSDHPMFEILSNPDWTPVLQKARSRYPESATIVGADLRLRTVLNNGVTALFEKDKDSRFVFKIQQERVKILVDTLDKQGKIKRESYE